MAFDDLFAARGLALASLGGAYLAVLANLVIAIALFLVSRATLVITPNRATKHYGQYVLVVLVSLLLATGLENTLLPDGSPTLQMALAPHLVLLIVLHLWIYYRQEPWLVALGGASIAAAGLVIGLYAFTSDLIHPAHWLAAGSLYALLGYLWFYSISTKRAFITADSIYIDSKELRAESALVQRPWLGWPQWVALVIASVALAGINSVLRGIDIAQIPAVQIGLESAFLLGITALVCAVPASTYWLTHKHWMPELTRFAWLVWLVVGFAFTYGNYLNGLDRV